MTGIEKAVKDSPSTKDDEVLLEVGAFEGVFAFLLGAGFVGECEVWAAVHGEGGFFFNHREHREHREEEREGFEFGGHGVLGCVFRGVRGFG
jgi:hypothetical protein